MLETKTGYWISRQTGISLSRVYRFSKGLTVIPQKFLSSVYNTYRREAYSIYRNQGFSSFQAARFRPYAPVHRKSILNDFNDKIKDLARGYATKRVEALGLKPTEENISRFISAGSRKIREGLRTSKTPYEVWLEYGK